MDRHVHTRCSGRRRGQPLLALLLALLSCVASAQGSNDDAQRAVYREAQRKYHRLLLGATLGITTWGVINWDYGARTPNSTSEGWFEYDTDSGGADKAGHFYTSYVMATALPDLYRDWGVSDAEASRRGLYSSLIINGVMEIGDSFSEYGFSWEDMVANGVGALAGYYTRGYEEPLDVPRRYGYVGLGINLSAVAERFGWRRTSSVLRYWQLPDTSVQARWSGDL